MLMPLSQSLQQHVAEFTSVLISPTLEENESFVNKIKQFSKISPQLAIDIYKNNTRGSRVNALKAVYPACKNILGKNIFRSIAKEFVDADIIGTSDLNNYGVAFDQHLNSILTAGRLPVAYNYLIDLARLEYKVHAAYYADDDPVFDFELFENRVQKAQQINFRVSESLALLAFQIPIHEIWMNNRNGADLRESSVQAITETQYLLVHRDENTPAVFEINYYEYQLLDAFMNNHSLQAVIDSIDCDVEKILPELIKKKWICGVT